MSYSGLLYDSSWHRSSGTVWLDFADSVVATKGLTFRSWILGLPAQPFLRAVSSIALLIGAAGVLLTFVPVVAMEAKYQLRQLTTDNRQQTTIQNEEIPPVPRLTGPVPTPTDEPIGPLTPVDAFSIHIPKINAHSVVIPNVDAANPDVYLPALTQGVAHALGTGLPGVKSDVNRTTYLFAHSTSAPSFVERYNAQFYLLYKLAVGDDIRLIYWAKSYQYRVVEQRVVAATDTSFLTPQTDRDILILATCTPPGTTWRRLLIIAERVE